DEPFGNWPLLSAKTAIVVHLDAYLFSVASRTIRAAALLASSFGVLISIPTTGWPEWSRVQWSWKSAFTLLSSLTSGLDRGMRTSAKTLLQVEQYQTKASFVDSTKAAFIRLGITQVSHRPEPIASPVDFKLQHYR